MLEWIAIAAAVLAVAIVAVIVSVSARRGESDRGREPSGPAHRRAGDRAGDPPPTERAHQASEYGPADRGIRPLARASRSGYVARWRAVQSAFVDHPGSAVGEADVLVNTVMRERGYPMDDDGRQAVELSPDHCRVLDDYRAVREAHEAGRRGTADTEQQRQAFVRYRAVFEDLLRRDEDPVSDLDGVPAEDATHRGRTRGLPLGSTGEQEPDPHRGGEPGAGQHASAPHRPPAEPSDPR